MIYLFAIVGIVAIVFALIAFRKKNIEKGTLLVIVLVSCALQIAGQLLDEPNASAARWASISIASALLLAIGLAKLMPKDNRRTE